MGIFRSESRIFAHEGFRVQLPFCDFHEENALIASRFKRRIDKSGIVSSTHFFAHSGLFSVTILHPRLYMQHIIGEMDPKGEARNLDL